jgi:hypothetical protein
MNHALHETITSFMQRFRVLKTERDLVHQAWQKAVRESDFDRHVSLMAREGNLTRETSALMSVFHQLMAQEQGPTQASRRPQPPQHKGHRGHTCIGTSERGD